MAVLPPDPVFILQGAGMGPVNCLCFHDTERLLAGTRKGSIYLWDLQTNRSPLNFSTGTDSILHISHLNDILITQKRCGLINTWSLLNSGYQLNDELQSNHLGYCRIECILEKNILLAPKDSNLIEIFSINNLSKSQQIFQPPTTLSKLGNIMCYKYITISNQSYVLAAYESGDILTWDLRCSKIINNVKFDEFPTSIDYDELTNRGICGGSTNKLIVFSYDCNSIQIKRKPDIPIKNPGINCIRIRKDQKVFCTGGWDHRIRIFSWKSLRPLAVLTPHSDAISDIVYSDGKVSMWKSPIMATAGYDGQISLWVLYN